MSITITPFNSGLQRGLKVYFFAASGSPENTVDVRIDIRQEYLKGLIKKVGSIRLFNQYATIRATDNTTGIDYFASASNQTCVPVNSLCDSFTISRYDNLVGATSFEMLIYEDVQPAYSILAVLP
jgi:hypothetical protein